MERSPELFGRKEARKYPAEESERGRERVEGKPAPRITNFSLSLRLVFGILRPGGACPASKNGADFPEGAAIGAPHAVSAPFSSIPFFSYFFPLNLITCSSSIALLFSTAPFE